MLKNLLSGTYGEAEVNKARGIVSTLTWDQATYLCRTAPDEIKYTVVMYVIDNSREKLWGISRKELVDLLGPPVGDKDYEVIYGCGSDSGSGFVFELDESGHVSSITVAN